MALQMRYAPKNLLLVFAVIFSFTTALPSLNAQPVDEEIIEEEIIEEQIVEEEIVEEVIEEEVVEEVGVAEEAITITEAERVRPTQVDRGVDAPLDPSVPNTIDPQDPAGAPALPSDPAEADRPLGEMVSSWLPDSVFGSEDAPDTGSVGADQKQARGDGEISSDNNSALVPWLLAALVALLALAAAAKIWLFPAKPTIKCTLEVGPAEIKPEDSLILNPPEISIVVDLGLDNIDAPASLPLQS